MKTIKTIGIIILLLILGLEAAQAQTTKA